LASRSLGKIADFGDTSRNNNLYGLEVCTFTKAELHSLDFAVTRFLMKLLKTSSVAVIKD